MHLEAFEVAVLGLQSLVPGLACFQAYLYNCMDMKLAFRGGNK